jgi:hypothetical protein
MRSLSPEAYAVIEGRHSDPFHYLGPHAEGDVSLVRVSCRTPRMWKSSTSKAGTTVATHP